MVRQDKVFAALRVVPHREIEYLDQVRVERHLNWGEVRHCLPGN
jgi:hypothetical protein